MVRKTREEKAITLIALIITIVVLLILAVVAINAVTGDGIIGHATNAKTQYEEAQREEQDILSYYGDYLATKGNAGTWKQEGDYIINANNEKILIGAKVNYISNSTETYVSKSEKTGIAENQEFAVQTGMSWYVIGEENGKIKLISSNAVGTTEGNAYLLYGIKGYINGVEELNKICSIYGKGEYAESARSINQEDITELCEITDGEIKIAGTNEGLYEYGAKYTYSYGDTDKDGNSTVEFSINGGTPVNTETDIFYLPDGSVINEENNGPRSLVSTWFAINTSNRKNGNLLKDENDNSVSYWVATKSTVVWQEVRSNHKKGFAQYYIEKMDYGFTTEYSNAGLYDSEQKDTGGAVNYLKVRPVVILEKDTVLTLNNGVYELSND